MKKYSKAFLDFHKAHKNLAKILGELEESHLKDMTAEEAELVLVEIFKRNYVNGQGFSSS